MPRCMEWFCLTEEQIQLAPDIEIPNMEMFCDIKLGVVVNIRRSTNPNFNQDVKDEISKSCKEFKTKQIFEEYLKTIDEQKNADDPVDKEDMAKKLEKFDLMMGKTLAVSEQTRVEVFFERKGAQSKASRVPDERIINIFEKS